MGIPPKADKTKRGRKKQYDEDFAVSKSVLQNWIGRSSSWLAGVQRERAFPQPVARGIFDVRAVFKWFFGDMAGDGEPTDLKEQLTKEKVDHEKIKAALSKLQLDVSRGKLLDAADVERGRVARVVAVRQKFLALPQEARGLYGHTPEQIGDWMEKKIRRICNNYAGDFSEEDAVVDEEGAAVVEGRPETDSVGMDE